MILRAVLSGVLAPGRASHGKSQSRGQTESDSSTSMEWHQLKMGLMTTRLSDLVLECFPVRERVALLQL